MDVLTEFARALKDRLGLEVRRRDRDGPVEILHIDLSPLRLSFPSRTPFFLLPAKAFGGEPSALDGYLQDLRTRLRLLDRVCFAVTDLAFESSDAAADRRLRQVVMLDRSAVEDLLRAPSLAHALVRHSRVQLSRAVLSPYETNRPVTGGRFFGRETEIRLVVSQPQTCYLILGMRRIGKSSLIREIKRRVDESGIYERRFGGEVDRRAGMRLTPPKDTAQESVVLIDCSPHGSTDSVLEKIVEQLNPRQVHRFRPDRFEDVLKQVSGRGARPVHIFLDEVERLVDLDRPSAWKALWQLRASAQAGYARYVFTGHQSIAETLSAERNPLFNFASLIELSGLNREDATKLIREPLKTLGIAIADPEVDRVVTETGGHPNLIQSYCQFFVRRAEQEGRDEVCGADFDELYQDANFDRFVLGTFNVNTTPLEKLIVFLTLKEDVVTKRDVDALLRSGPRVFVRDAALTTALDRLRYAGIFRPNGAAYELNMPLLRRLLNEHYDVDYLLDHVKVEQPDVIAKVFSPSPR